MSKEKFIREMEKCRKAYENAGTILDRIMEKVADEFEIDLSHIESDAENASNIEEAIYCFVQYGEYDAEYIWKELEASRNVDITD